jgi:hypothetical protein
MLLFAMLGTMRGIVRDLFPPIELKIMDWLVLQPQFRSMLPEVASIMTTFCTGLVAATPTGPSPNMGSRCRRSPD